jgi:hypothetical protein
MTEEATFRSRLTWVSLVRGILRIVVNKAENIPDPSDSLAVGNEAEETATEHSEDRVVLEQEPDDGDVLSLVDHDAQDTADQ